ncbi:hypothetical protein SDC9_181061 [bioreactor metagenome]|uniref:Uncharacterized protein n=1 Tax=bioreactor metagenome TaxID=1076179 RepID=A0A645H5F4_9ZZZZ
MLEKAKKKWWDIRAFGGGVFEYNGLKGYNRPKLNDSVSVRHSESLQPVQLGKNKHGEIVVNQGIYVSLLEIDTDYAKKNDFSVEDVEMLKRNLQHMWENRNLKQGETIEMLAVIWWTHPGRNKSIHPLKLRDSVDIFPDGHVEVKRAPKGVTTELVYAIGGSKIID